MYSLLQLLSTSLLLLLLLPSLSHCLRSFYRLPLRSFSSSSSSSLFRYSPNPALRDCLRLHRTRLCLSSSSSYTSSSFTRQLKDLYRNQNYNKALDLLFNRIEDGYVPNREDIEIGTTCSWEARSSKSSYRLLQLASQSEVRVSRASIYSSMRTLCVDNKYTEIFTLLNDTFPLGSPFDPFLPSDRLQWLSRAHCELRAPQLALNLIRNAAVQYTRHNSHPNHTSSSSSSSTTSSSSSSSAVLLTPALRTIMQTCTKLRFHAEVLEAYTFLCDLYSNNSSSLSSILLGNDYLSVFRSSRALDKHSIACDILSLWSSRRNNTSSKKVDEIIPTPVQYNQGIGSAIAINNFPVAHRFLQQLYSLQYSNISSSSASLLYHNLRMNQLSGFHSSLELVQSLNISLSPDDFTALFATTATTASSQYFLIDALLSSNLTADYLSAKTLSMFLETCRAEKNTSLAKRAIKRLQESGFPLNLIHYSIIVKCYKEGTCCYRFLGH